MLLAAGLENAANESRWLVESLTGCDAAVLLDSCAAPVTPEDAKLFYRLIERRIAGEPLQYLLGRWEFAGLPFDVGPGVLIPRPETELTVELALEAIAGKENPHILDLCSGSGCIPIAIGKARTDALLWGVELSPAALTFFRRNIQINSAANVTAVEGNVFSPPPEVCCRQYDVITSNPPYISHSELSTLQAEVQHEPAMALDGGSDGLDFYRKLPRIAAGLLKPGGVLCFEIGDTQAHEVSGLVSDAGFTAIKIHIDCCGNDRALSASLA